MQASDDTQVQETDEPIKQQVQKAVWEEPAIEDLPELGDLTLVTGP
jgi:hypothetical protein